jgi:phosphopantothenoylcysteine synthetase/decarboxylase
VNKPRIELVVCAAPLARRAPDLVSALTVSGWEVTATTSFNAEAWVDPVALVAAGSTNSRRPVGAPRPEPASAVVLAPATFNTLNKLRAGISDTPALGVLNDAIGQQLPVLLVPMISERLVGHPAWAETFRWLQLSWVTFLDPANGRTAAVEPLRSGIGEDIIVFAPPG